MEVLPVYNLKIESHKGPYSVNMVNKISELPWDQLNSNHFFIIDRNVYQLYRTQLPSFISDENTILIDVSEENKDLDKIPDLIKALMDKNVKRNAILVAIGGGITQDLTCFIASTIFRGMKWKFIPTTLLAQSDSCIGSKSSINVKGIKNLVGTFYPPEAIFIVTDFLKTLSENEILSGIGEMVKVHIIDGQNSFDSINTHYLGILKNENEMLAFIKRSLEIKKRVIEIDEFDVNYRNIMNYGHTFGHAIETATNYSIPHGIAVAIGMDMANFTAAQLKLIPEESYKKMSTLLNQMYQKFISHEIKFEKFISGIKQDKKNVGSQITLILPIDTQCEIKKYPVEGDDRFKELCQIFFKQNNFKLK